MRNPLILFLVLTAVALTGPALASPKQLSATDRRLNTVFNQLLAQLPASGQRQLRTAQNQWSLFRNAECTYRQAAFAIMTSDTDCRRELTEHRIKELRLQHQWLTKPADG